ncbi:hypothetical protein LAZ67_1000585 [Cordylochernes scorpioides]|uniref:G-protein coupled receptors family 1 profile domain-containing protein n=1 Tax=Cordylochernes scorpioides TaxID=51811 RepID=A0ABY6JVK2_9ARAC|nr:hypothetical protein LAZ67_1000585 [Cordylochernes scorpioides]
MEPRWLSLGGLVVAGALGNTLVCLAVSLERRLHNLTNYFLLSLAVADLLVSVVVMPFGILDQLYGKLPSPKLLVPSVEPTFCGWPLGWETCAVWVTCDVLSCTASILHMCCISVERYVGIRSPLGSRGAASKRAVVAKVALVWLLAGAITSPITVLAALDPANVLRDRVCAINNRFFFVFGSVVAFYVPMVLMVGAYVLTVRLLRRKARKLLSPADSSCNNSKGGGGGGLSRRWTVQRGDPGGIVRRSQVRSEQRASKVLGVVFFTFVVCWAPFFVLNVLFAFRTRVPKSVATACLWLGYVSSTINPIIYTVFNRTFRRTFWRLLLCRCSTYRHVRARSQGTYRGKPGWPPSERRSAKSTSLC